MHDPMNLALVEKLRKKLQETHYLCERCGGYGRQEKGCYDSETKKYDAPEGICQLCDGCGYLGIKQKRNL